MRPADREQIRAAISLLEGLLGEGSEQSPVNIVIPGLDEAIGELNTKANACEPQIREITQLFVKSNQIMHQIINKSKNCPKFTNKEAEQLVSKFTLLQNSLADIKAKKTFAEHAVAISELIGCFQWVFGTQQMSQVIIKGAVESSDFYALKFQQKKKPQHNDWYKAVKKVIKILEGFVVQTFPRGLVFNSAGKDSWEKLEVSGNNQQKGPTVHEAAKSNQVQRPQISVGQKKPKSSKYYKAEKIVLGSESVSINNAVFIDKSEGCEVQVTSKFNTVTLSGCKNMRIVTTAECIGKVEFVNCETIQLFIQEKITAIEIEKSRDVRITMNELHMGTCEIISQRADELNIRSYNPTSMQETKDFHIHDQLITKWDPKEKSFVSKIFNLNN